MAFLFCLLPSAFCLAQDWTLSTADFRTESVAVRSIDDKGIHVIWQGQPRLIPADEFLQIDRNITPVERPTRFVLTLVGGDRVGGEPVKVADDRLTWRNASVGELVIPLTQVASIAKPGQTPDTSAKRTDDVVLLANGDRVAGIVTAMSASRVDVKSASAGSDDAPTPVPLDSILSVQFASTGGGGDGAKAAPTTSSIAPGGDVRRSYRVRLDDGSSLIATSLTLSADDKLVLAVGGGEPRPLALARVAGIEQVNGPVSWLTSRTPSEDLQVPFLGTSTDQGMWRKRVDTDVAGQPFLVGGQTFKRGIGVHSYSRLVYPLDGTYKAFRTRYGINDSLTRGDVAVRILAGEKVLHAAQHVRAGVVSPVVLVELPEDAKSLTLEVDYGDGIDVEDRLNWLEPALLREMPKPPESPPPAAAAATRPSTNPATAPVPAATASPTSKPSTPSAVAAPAVRPK